MFEFGKHQDENKESIYPYHQYIHSHGKFPKSFESLQYLEKQEKNSSGQLWEDSDIKVILNVNAAQPQ